MTRTYKISDNGGMSAVTMYFPALTSDRNYHLVVSMDNIFNLGDDFYPLTEVGLTGDYWVEHDFPDDQEVYWTLVENTPWAPGGVASADLRLWLKGDRFNGVPATRVWNDISPGKRNATTAQSSVVLSANQLNFHPYVETGTLDRQFSTVKQFDGHYMFVVGTATGASGLAGYIGFDGDAGMRADNPSTGDNIRQHGNVDDWAGSGTPGSDGVIHYNGIDLDVNTVVSTTHAPTDEWSVIAADWQTGGNHSTNEFYLGGYFAGRTFTNYTFAEVIVYENHIVSTNNEMERINAYLCLKYGITSEIDYYNSNNLSVWTLGGGYDNDIAGLARDDLSCLNQKQSQSINDDAIVAFGNVALNVSNAANPNRYGNDYTFLIWGNDDGGSCWSNANLNVPGEERWHIRVERQWSFERTNTIDSIEVALDADDVDFDLPALPTGASSWYMYVDNNANFTTATPIQLAFDAVSGRWRGFVDPTDIPAGTSYFTFGARLDPIIVDNRAYCLGDTINFIGSNLADAGCVRFELSDGGTPVDTLSEHASNISFSEFIEIADEPGACLDTFAWIAPGAYANVTLDVDPYTGANCNNPMTFGDFIIQNSFQVTVMNPVTADINGASDTTICVGSNNVVINTSGSGTFSLDSTSGTATLAQLITGTSVNVHSGNLGYHRLLMSPSGGCALNDTIILRIDTMHPSNLTYAQTNYCKNQGLIGPTNTNGWSPLPPEGLFVAHPSGLNINAADGTFNTITADTGTYIVTYHAPADSCVDPASFVLTVQLTDSANFSYVPDRYCMNDSNPSPVINWLPTNIPQADRYFHETGGNLNLDLDSITGVINLAGSQFGAFEVGYRISGSTCAFEFTDSVFLDPLPAVTFTIPDSLCTTGNPTFTPMNPGPPGTHTWSNWTGNVDIHPNTGVITFANSDPGGPYPITLSVDDGTCSDSLVKNLYLIGIDSLDIQYPKNYVCLGEPNPIPVIAAGVAGGTFIEQTGGLMFANAQTGEIDVAGSTTGVYTIEYALPATHCGDTVVIYSTFTVDQAPLASFTIDSTYFCHGLASQMNILHANVPFSFWAYDGGTQLQVSNPPHAFMLLGSMMAGHTYRLESITSSA
ncbi:MAG: hypothetical protein AAF570_06095, partial [Bacteroidota bacterium]